MAGAAQACEGSDLTCKFWLFAASGGPWRLSLHCRLCKDGIRNRPLIYSNRVAVSAQSQVAQMRFIAKNDIPCSVFAAARKVLQHMVVAPLKNIPWEFEVGVPARFGAAEKALWPQIAQEVWKPEEQLEFMAFRFR
jgi:hypothetical protein